MSLTYILDEHGNPVQEHDFVTWADWFMNTDRIIAREEINGVIVSTVFLGSDLIHGGTELFETMIFGGVNDGAQIRYDTREHALQGHAKAVIIVMNKKGSESND